MSLYAARKYPPFLPGDGVHSIRDLLIAHNEALQSRGLSPASAMPDRDTSLDAVLPKGERWEIPGRMNLSAGGTMALEAPRAEAALTSGWKDRRGRLDFVSRPWTCLRDIGGDPRAIRVIEVNSNPSIRLLEDSGRGDLILKIWHHTFSAMGLLECLIFRNTATAFAWRGWPSCSTRSRWIARGCSAFRSL